MNCNVYYFLKYESPISDDQFSSSFLTLPCFLVFIPYLMCDEISSTTITVISSKLRWAKLARSIKFTLQRHWQRAWLSCTENFRRSST